MTLYILNLCDLALTLYALSHGAREVNPFLQSVPFMIFYKVVMVGIFCWVLSTSNIPLAQFGLKAGTIVYALVLTWNIYGILTH